MRKRYAATLALALALTFGCDGSKGNDIANYRTVKIGTQTWMAENLDYNVKGSKCYDNKPANCKKYGRLYDWNTAMVACPKGWHLPSNEEWDKLLHYADGTSGTESPYNSPTAGKSLKSKSGWNDIFGSSGNGTDAFGFAALPTVRGEGCSWWSSSKNGGSSYTLGMVYLSGDVLWNYDNPSEMLSVRCVRD
jgi:uncharacterized protein (TIGR02145 family)